MVDRDTDPFVQPLSGPQGQCAFCIRPNGGECSLAGRRSPSGTISICAVAGAPTAATLSDAGPIDAAPASRPCAASICTGTAEIPAASARARNSRRHPDGLTDRWNGLDRGSKGSACRVSGLGKLSESRHRAGDLRTAGTGFRYDTMCIHSCLPGAYPKKFGLRHFHLSP